MEQTAGWRPIAEADKSIAYIHRVADLSIGNSYPIWARDEDGRVFEALWSDNGKKAYWWDMEGESPVDPVEFMPHPLDRKFFVIPAKAPIVSEADDLIERCAQAAEAIDRIGYEWVKDSLWANILRRAGANVRALKNKAAAGLRRVRHKKRGSIYSVIGYGFVQTDAPLTDYSEVVVYRADDGSTWVRPPSEFEDGRFEEISG